MIALAAALEAGACPQLTSLDLVHWCEMHSLCSVLQGISFDEPDMLQLTAALRTGACPQLTSLDLGGKCSACACEEGTGLIVHIPSCL